jgi:adenosylmethionine-8-amino-7-oxononanoate aminotransferase
VSPKGITGGYLPLAATFATQRIFDAFLGDPWEGRTFFHGHTYTGNPLACAAALASLELFERNNVLDHVREVEGDVRRMMTRFYRNPFVGGVRLKGMMMGIEIVQEREGGRPFDPRRRVGAEVCAKMRKRGIILRPLGDVVVVMPPLAMPAAQVQRILSELDAEIQSLA